MKPQLAYIMSRFPGLSETFILREMNQLEALGWNITLFPMVVQQEQVVHADVNRWMGRVRAVPFMSLAVLKSNLRTLLKRPTVYAELVWRTLWENRSNISYLVKSLALLPKSVHTAYLMREADIEHIHAHFATFPAYIAWVIHRLTDISYSVTAHAHDLYVSQAMLPTKLGEATFIAAISDYNRSYIQQTLGNAVYAKTHVVRCGIILDTYQPHQRRATTSERLEIISTGSLRDYKGFPYLIQACALLRDQGLDFRCRIIGEGPQRSELENLISVHTLQDHVHLLGAQPQEEVARLLPTAHCYVQPSIITASGKMEGIPVALMEALACGLPTVATAISGIAELVRPDETGYLVPPASPQALADAINHIASHEAEAEQLGQAGRELVLHEFTLNTNVQHLADLFTQAQTTASGRSLTTSTSPHLEQEY